MKLRHAAALALVGWFLATSQALPNEDIHECPDCAVGGIVVQGFGGPPYQAKADCEKAGQQFIRNVYAEARKEGERVTESPSFSCTERKSSK